MPPGERAQTFHQRKYLWKRVKERAQISFPPSFLGTEFPINRIVSGKVKTWGAEGIKRAHCPKAFSGENPSNAWYQVDGKRFKLDDHFCFHEILNEHSFKFGFSFCNRPYSAGFLTHLVFGNTNTKAIRFGKSAINGNFSANRRHPFCLRTLFLVSRDTNNTFGSRYHYNLFTRNG